MTEPSEQMRQDLVNRAVKMLVMAKADFKVVLGQNEWGELNAKQRKRSIQNKGVVEYIRSFVNGMKEGDYVVVPAHPTYTPDALQASAAAVLVHRFGRGSIITHKLADGGVEVMLVEDKHKSEGEQQP